MEKVKVSKKVAETLNLVKEKIWTDGDHWKIVRDHVLTRANFCVKDLEPLNILPLDTLIRALYIGYEVEQTPEDKVREYFKDQLSLCRENLDQEDSTPYAIQKVLDLLNIKIPGVNE